jgi:hypothetical protein
VGTLYDEYLTIFALTETDLRRSIHGCSDDPAGFNAEPPRRGEHIVSVNPIYVFDAPQINKRLSGTREW